MIDPCTRSFWAVGAGWTAHHAFNRCPHHIIQLAVPGRVHKMVSAGRAVSGVRKGCSGLSSEDCWMNAPPARARVDERGSSTKDPRSSADKNN